MGMDRDQARALLGLNEGASDVEIKRAYRDLMRTVHPDKHGGDPAAARLAVLANEAKDVLLAGGGAEVRPPRPPWDEASEEERSARPGRKNRFERGPGRPPGRDTALRMGAPPRLSLRLGRRRGGLPTGCRQRLRCW